MKGYSAAQIKKGFRVPIKQFPKEGSRVRELFDILHKYKGNIIEFGKVDRKFHMRIKYLKDFYGMDIEHVGKGQWCFQGEDIGMLYISYLDDKSLHIKLKKKR